MKNSFLSVVIAVYNCEKYIGEAIESLLAQTRPADEILVIDDGSTDNTADIVQKYPVSYLWQENQGQSAALNYGLRNAKGELLAFLDADDRNDLKKFENQLSFLESHSDIDMVFGEAKHFISPELPEETKKRWICPDKMPGYLLSAGLLRKSCFERAGLFSETRAIGQFIEWYMRAVDTGLKSAYQDAPALYRRIHENNMGTYAKDSRIEYVRILRDALERRRALAC